MAVSSRPLALSLPLHGSRLIEASAGTGKTYTISALYVRLILGHGGTAAFRQSLLPPQILVLSFTDAATRELRDRIRRRLVEAADAFTEATVTDPLLEQLRADFDPATWPACAQRLQIAAQWMDEAAVATIHGWCQRMLREHAFDSGSLFQQTLNTDPSELMQTVVRDYWRQQAYPLAGADLDWVRAQWRHPDKLAILIAQPLLDPLSQTPPTLSLGQLLQTLRQQREQALQAIQQHWRAAVDCLTGFYEQASAAKLFNGTKLSPRIYQPRLARLRAWTEAEPVELDMSDDYFKRFTHDGLLDACRKDAHITIPAEVSDWLDAMAALPAQFASLPALEPAALRHAAAWIRARFGMEQRQRAEMGFDDMLSQLDAALHGPQGEHLAQVIRSQFPVAMVDEFQDTDPIQYRIFDRIYSVNSASEEHALLLIGDPKQAIYAFRGADIHTYLKARAATSGRHYALDTNFRSTAPMVAAVNRFFALAEQRNSGHGAFLFRQPNHNPLPFVAVQAQGRNETWSIDGDQPPALQLWQRASDEPLSSDNYRTELAAAAATEIVRLLDLSQQGRAGFASPRGLRPLQANDIAVLVRDGAEALAIRSALAQRGVRSVYLSDKDSVYASHEAKDILLWLKACAEPGQDRLLRAALASRSLGLSLAELEHLNLDEAAWEARLSQFRDYHQQWQRQGVLPMLRRLIHDFALPARLIQLSDGERRLTNLLHLAELLQQAATEHDGEQALLRYFSECLSSERSPHDQQIIRLESDEALLRVITIHKSKGLEYPLVWLPFIAHAKPIKTDKPLLLSSPQPRWIWRPSEAEYAQAEHERLAEDLRLLYVGLTRAQFACWLGVADRKMAQGKNSALHLSAIGYVLGGGQPLATSRQLDDWLQVLAEPGQIAISPLPEPSAQVFTPVHHADFKPVWRQPQRRAAETWWIASYSALNWDQSPLAADESPAATPVSSLADTAALANALDSSEARASVETPGTTGQAMHGFPRGAEAGSFLHGLLEWAAEHRFKAAAAVQRDMIARRCVLRGQTEWIDTLHGWLSQLQQQPLLPGKSWCLAELCQFQAELEFWFQASHVDVGYLDQLVCTYEQPGLARPACQPLQLNGMFKGFIDLCFAADGRYYLIDYKSNWLGPDASAYTPASLSAAILSHRYDLQYVLYTLALHRQLQLRLADYDYDRHIGGAIYMFVRAPAEGLYHARPSRQLIEALDQLFRAADSAAKDAG